MPDERPTGGSGSDPYGGGYSFGPFSGDQPAEETTQPVGWQPGVGQQGSNEPTQPLAWQPVAGQEAGTEQTQQLPWAPISSSGPEDMQIGRYSAPPAGPPGGIQPGRPVPAPRRQNRLLIMAAVVIAALVLTGVGVGIAVTSGRTGSGAPTQAPTGGSSDPTSQSSTAAPAASLASDAVRGYLEAVAAGDASAALAYAEEPPRSELLTDAVLAESKRRAPITAIDVPAVDDKNASAVAANYKIGSTHVSHTYQVIRTGAGQWKLASVTAVVEIDYQPGAGMKINGAKLTGALPELLPGSYVITTSSKYVKVASASFVVKGAGSAIQRHATPASLTKAGKKLATSAAKKDLNRCLGTRAIAPKNCPFGVRSNGFKNTKSTIRWTVVGKDPFAKAKLKLVEDDIIVSSISIRLRFSSSCTRNGVPYLCHADINNSAWATVPLASPKKVRWTATKR
jgi:hypothetical protein